MFDFNIGELPSGWLRGDKITVDIIHDGNMGFIWHDDQERNLTHKTFGHTAYTTNASDIKMVYFYEDEIDKVNNWLDWFNRT